MFFFCSYGYDADIRRTTHFVPCFSKRILPLIAALLTCLILSVSNPAQAAVPDTLLHSFADGSVPHDANAPNDLILGSDGNFYGTSGNGGSAGSGAVFQVTPAGAITVLHSFGDGSVANDGTGPNDLAQGSDGNFYGTTYYGGSTVAADANHQGYGTAFKMTPAGVVTLLHSFGDGTVPHDGYHPSAALVQGRDGNFYGVTYYGGSTGTVGTTFSGNGTAFKITPSGTETTLHNFADGSVANDGDEAYALTLGTDGNFYGTTAAGGGPTYGTVYRMTPAGTVTILHQFDDGTTPHDGILPFSALVLGPDGNFYGVTFNGGTTINTDPNGYGFGTVFKITPSGTETTLHNFNDGSVANDGYGCQAALTIGSDGTIYGTNGGLGTAGQGTVFKITPSGTETILHDYQDGSVTNDGSAPNSLVFGRDANLYGTTLSGGSTKAPDPNHQGYGTMYRLSVSGSAAAATLTALSPSSVPAGHAAFPMTITGTGFASGAVVDWNGTALTTTYGSTTQLTASVPASLVQTAGSTSVTAVEPGAAASNALTFTITATVPTITSFTPASGSAGTSVTITGTNFAGATSVKFNATVATAFTVASATSITATVPTGAATGTISVTTPGGTAASTSNFTVTTTSGPPTITGFSPSSGPVGTMVVITGTNLTGATVVGFQGQHATSFTINANGTQITTAVPSGAISGPVAVATPAGTAHSSASFTVTTTSGPPTVTSFTPVSGPVGTSVTITGTNFTGTTAVTFNTTAATFSVVSTTSITASIPAGATTGKISVTTSTGTVASAGSFTVTMSSAPTITGFTPTSGPVGTAVTITGTNLTGATIVGFQGQHATSFTVNGAGTQVTTSVPNGAATGPIAIATPGGTAKSATSFTVATKAAPPTITSFTPATGPVGTSVTITGTGFMGATSVKFNATVATAFTVASATSITATVPTGAATGTISVTTPGGTAASTSNFTVTTTSGPPTITGFSPSSGPVGTMVVITGTNFTGAMVVGFQGQHATSFTINANGTQITTTVPNGAATGPVAVATPAGTAKSATSFTVTTGNGITLEAFAASPTTVAPGGSFSLAAVISASAPAGGVSVTLTQNGVAQSPLVIAAGQDYGTVSATAGSTAGTYTFVASYGGISKTVVVTVTASS